MNWEELKHFKRHEFSNPDGMAEDLLWKLDHLRRISGLPIYISSSYRADEDGAHGYGLAVDIVDDLDQDFLTSYWRYKILQVAFDLHFKRIGVYDGHIHLDIATDPTFDQEVCWWGKSSR